MLEGSRLQVGNKGMRIKSPIKMLNIKKKLKYIRKEDEDRKRSRLPGCL